MIYGIVVFSIVAFFVFALLAAFIYIRFRWSQHVRSDSTEVVSTVRQRKAAPVHDGQPGESVTLSYEFSGKYHSPEEWFFMRRTGQQFVPIYVLVETPAQPIIRQDVLDN